MVITRNDKPHDMEPGDRRPGLSGLFESATNNGHRSRIERDAADTAEAIRARSEVLKTEDIQYDKTLTKDDKTGEYHTAQELRDIAIRLSKMETEDEMRLALAGVLSGRVMALFFRRLEALEQRNEKTRAKRDADSLYLALLQAQIDDLNWQIGEMEDARDYLAKTGDVEGAMNMPGVRDAIEAWEKKHKQKFDPNAPDAKRVLDQILDERQKDLKAEKAELAENLKHEVKGISGPIDQENITAEQQKALEHVDKAKEKLRELDQVEKSIAKSISDEKNGTEKAVALDSLVETLDERTKAKMLKDSSTDPDLLDRLRLDKFDSLYKRIESLKGQPTYEGALKGILTRIDSETKKLLLDRENTPQEVKAALSSPPHSTVSHAKTLDSESADKNLNINFNNQAKVSPRENETPHSLEHKVAAIVPSNGIS